ncbi:carboxylesterase family protein [Larkinella sp.]|uniref:carboxylesterase family protein n=1 Tax=Larkinella sp. TaxID=2034517 RepID=UPI003BAC1D46
MLYFKSHQLLLLILFHHLLLLAALPGLSQTVPLGVESRRHIEHITPTARKQSMTYATKESIPLKLDVYTTGDSVSTQKKACVLFVFGGAFMTGRRDDSLYNNYFNSLLAHNYVVISMSYRLGLKGVKNLSKFNITPLEKAIGMAVDDVYDATNWIINHAGKLEVDTSQIVLSGSSSGAITVLEADFNRRNRQPVAQKLPANFNYAGIVAFSGAIFSVDGRLQFKVPPAPVLLFHGTADKMVPYEQIRFLNRGMFGSASIARTFKEKGYPYYIYRAEGLGHEVSVLPMIDQLPIILDFLSQFVANRKRYQIDLSVNDPAAKPTMVLTPRELFRKLQQTNP